MSEEERKELIKRLKEEDLDKTSSFTDIMSRSEKRRRDEEKEINSSNIEEVKVPIKEEIIKPIEEKKETIAKPITKPIKEHIEEIVLDDEETPSKHTFLNTIITLILLCGLGGIGYFIYTKIDTNSLDLSTIINTSIISLIIIMFIILTFIKKEVGKKVIVLFTGILMISLLGYNYINKDDQTKLKLMPSFINKNITDALTWSEKNSFETSQIYEYSDNIGEFNIISQSINPNETLEDQRALELVVSNGPNYDKEVIIPNMIGMSIDEAVKVIKENHLNNVTVNFIKNEQEKDIIIKQSTNGIIKRNDKLTLTVSLGNGTLPEVNMIDLSNYELFDALLWLNRNGIKNKLTYEFSDEVKRNFVIKQDKEVNTVLKPNSDTVTITISKGKEIVVPNLASMSVKEVTDWVIKNKLKIEFKEIYDVEKELGSIIKANYKEGSKIEEGTKIIITTSKGKLKMESFKTYNEFKAWADNLGLKYTDEDEYSDLEKGKIISISPKAGEYIDVSTPIKITYSKGKKTTIPNFYNKSKSYITSECSRLGLSCYFNYGGYNSSISKDYAISQQFKSGSTVPSGTSMSITLSSGKATTYTGIVIQEGWLVLGDADRTISTLRSKLKSACPGVNFSIIKKSHTTTKGLIHPNSPIRGATSYSFTQGKTYTIYVVG